ncbi:barstar family protein [uncultured Tenacibaculum sp.]|uniref:barstar family protein n=1 Tax=uncultured Tenacibaculum sp. TaxID=174713 RepID=UPI0026241323|nr:barstar family protein [uncultured Tenacibaculum sp.]
MSDWKPTYTINGNKFSNEKGFYNEIERVFTNDLNWRIGRNLDAFNDVLSGGFGTFDVDEEIIIEWKNFYKSEENLETSFLHTVIEIIEQNKHITFIKS